MRYFNAFFPPFSEYNEPIAFEIFILFYGSSIRPSLLACEMEPFSWSTQKEWQFVDHFTFSVLSCPFLVLSWKINNCILICFEIKINAFL